MRGKSSSQTRRALERMLFGVALVCLGWYGLTTLAIYRLQSEARVAIERIVAERERRGPLDRPPSPSDSGLIGRLDIPRIHLSAVVMEGADGGVLESAVGYLPDTPRPWQPGNSALAAHRDRLFRPLKRIRVGDYIRLATPHGDFQYRVRRTMVVDPEDVWVLDPLPHVSLTLITCFPFEYVGHARQRFIVQAEKIQTEVLWRPAH